MILFCSLTVDEQIWFYGRLKGLNSQEVKKEIAKMVSDVGLVEKKKDLVKNLSGRVLLYQVIDNLFDTSVAHQLLLGNIIKSVIDMLAYGHVIDLQMTDQLQKIL